MNYCVECGTKLEIREDGAEGMVPYCPRCEQFKFPIFNTAVSMIVHNPDRDKILLIKQYGKGAYVLVAGYINKGEGAECAVVREVKEETGLEIQQLFFNRSCYFEPSNTLMLNFTCTASTESLAGLTDEVDEAAWFTLAEARQNIKPDSLAQFFLNSYLDGD